MNNLIFSWNWQQSSCSYQLCKVFGRIFRSAVLNLLWLMDHLFKKISAGPRYYADTSWTQSV